MLIAPKDKCVYDGRYATPNAGANCPLAIAALDARRGSKRTKDNPQPNSSPPPSSIIVLGDLESMYIDKQLYVSIICISQPDS